MMNKILVVVYITVVTSVYGAKILAVFPFPSISHQVVFRPITEELAKRGHEVTVITTDPAFPKGQAPLNLREIDVHDVSYSVWREGVLISSLTTGSKKDTFTQAEVSQDLMIDIFEIQMGTDEVQEIITNKTIQFDLILTEAVVRPALGFSHLYKVPLIQISSVMPIYNNAETMGAANHPILYPSLYRQKINNLSNWDKLAELYTQWKVESIFDLREETMTNSLRRIFGPDVPHIRELYNNIDMLLLNAYRLWDHNRPVPPSCVYMGGIHKNPEKELPKDLQSYLDSSKNGVIYMSFGTNVSPSALPLEKIQIFVKVFSTLPYDILWKWDQDELPGRSPNIKISKWLPQSDLLKHPKIKFFITQGGLQSTDEAITAGVPLLGIPMLGDQWHNGEQYVRLNIGNNLHMEDLTEELLRKTIDKLINDNLSYRASIVKIRSLFADQPETPLERAIWWIEHVLRQGGGRHLRGPAANMSWAEYLELELILYVLFSIAVALFIIVFAVYYLISNIKKQFGRSKLKIN